MIERGDFNIRYYNECETIIGCHDRFLKKYESLKLEMDPKNLDPKLVYQNGQICKIINHKKLHMCMKYWIAKQQTLEFKTLYPVYFHLKNKG